MMMLMMSCLQELVTLNENLSVQISCQWGDEGPSRACADAEQVPPIGAGGNFVHIMSENISTL